MKKLLNISVIAALAIMPFAANAQTGDIVAGAPTALTSADPAQAAADVTATDAPKYALAVETTNDDKVATAGYVKGAYNAAIRAVNNVAGTLATVQSTAANAANQDLGNLSATGKANVSAQGTYDANTNYTAGTVGAAIKAKADASTTLAGYGITDAYTKSEVDSAVAGSANTATYSNQTTYGTGTVGAAIKTLETNAANYATTTGVVATVEAATASKTGASLSVTGNATGDVTSTFTGGNVNIPTSATVDTLTTWGDDTTTGTAQVTLTNTATQVSGTVSSTFSNGSVTGTATGNITDIDVTVASYQQQ